MSLRARKPAHTKPQFMTIKCDQFKGWADGLMCNKKPFVVPPRYQLDDAYYVASEMINEPDFEAFTQNACRYEAPSSKVFQFETHKLLSFCAPMEKDNFFYFIDIDFGAVQGLSKREGKLPRFRFAQIALVHWRLCVEFTTPSMRANTKWNFFLFVDQYSNGFNVCSIIDEAENALGPFLSGRMFDVLKMHSNGALACLKHSCVCTCVGLERSKREKKETRKTKTN